MRYSTQMPIKLSGIQPQEPLHMPLQRAVRRCLNARSRKENFFDADVNRKVDGTFNDMTQPNRVIGLIN